MPSTGACRSACRGGRSRRGNPTPAGPGTRPEGCANIPLPLPHYPPHHNFTIKISDDVCTLLNGIYTIDLQSLINCDLEMENVLLDASDLILPEGFDPATTSVVFDFGDDVTIKQAIGLDMRLGNYWSTSLNLDQQGKVILTKLVDTPEPATGTLGLLALAALAARRRKK